DACDEVEHATTGRLDEGEKLRELRLRRAAQPTPEAEATARHAFGEHADRRIAGELAHEGGDAAGSEWRARVEPIRRALEEMREAIARRRPHANARAQERGRGRPTTT